MVIALMNISTQDEGHLQKFADMKEPPQDEERHQIQRRISRTFEPRRMSRVLDKRHNSEKRKSDLVPIAIRQSLRRCNIDSITSPQ